jgi:hypothetical protein
MSYKPSYSKGDFKAICDVCGRLFKGSQLIQRWDGVRVCSEDFEVRHPQDFVRGVPDFQVPPFTRPETQDNFILPNGLICPSLSSKAGLATAGCATAGS